MLVTLEGVYRNGQVELSERPKDVQAARVLVTFLSEPESASRDSIRRRAFARMEEGFDLGGGPYLSEDFQHGPDLAGAQVVNPFR